MEEKKYDFDEMASNLSYVGNNDPYTADVYFSVLEQLQELAELQEQVIIMINKLERENND